MKALWNLARQNAGFALLCVNAALALIALFAYDPFGWIRTGYGGAALVGRGAGREIDVRQVKLESPEKGGFTVVLTRGERAPGQKLDEKHGPQFAWQLRVGQSGSHGEARAADGERVRELFRALSEARRYYALKRTPQNDREFELGTNEQGQARAPKLTLVTDGGRSVTLHLGRASGGESYVRADDEDEVFLVQTNLRSAVGSTEPEHFRNRRLVNPEMPASQVEALSAEFPGSTRRLSLARGNKGGWELHGFVRGPADGAAVDSLLGDIVGWKALSFPTEIPKDADRRVAVKLLLYIKAPDAKSDSRSSGLKLPEGGAKTQPGRQIRLEVIARRDYSNYYVRSEDTLYEISSVFLADLFEADRKLVARTGRIRMPEEPPPGE